MATRKELTVVVSDRYRIANHAEKTRILDEFADMTGYHRKHAMRLLRRGQSHPDRRAERDRPVLGVKAKPAARGASRALTPARGSGLRLP